MLCIIYGPGVCRPLLEDYKKDGDNGLWESLKPRCRAKYDGVLQILPGLQNRRIEEFELFTTGDYNYGQYSKEKIDRYY